MIIYAIQNKVNSKCYIGKTMYYNKRRKIHINQLEKQKHPNNYLQKSWTKYGKNNFKFIVIEDEFKTEDELNEAEQFWIRYLQTISPYGYNLTYGGEGVLGLKFSKEHKNKISKAVTKYKPLGVYSKKGEFISKHKNIPELKNEYNFINVDSQIKNGDLVDNKYQIIKIDYDNPPQKIKRYRNKQYKYAGKYNKNGELIEIYFSVKEASENNNASLSSISAAAKNENYTANNYMWRVCSQKDKLPKKISPYGNYKKRINSHKTKKVIQYDLDGNYIQIFDSLKSATKDIGNKKSSTITECCKGNYTHAGGYLWKFYTKNYSKKIKPVKTNN